MRAADALPDDVADALRRAGSRLGPFAAVRYFGEVQSTNDIALALAESGAPHGTAVLADVQHAGRGRRGRTWFSPPGTGLYVSIVLRPPGSSQALNLVTLAAGLAAARGVRASSGLPVELKWPNDLVMGRPWRKLGGVLCEASGSGGRIGGVVVGIGINALRESYPPELGDRATSIETELGRPIDRAIVLVQLLEAMYEVSAKLFAGGGRWVCDEWRRFGRAGLSGRVVRWQDQQGPHQGVARDIGDDGALLVEVDGRTVRVMAGEVTWDSWSRE